MAQGRKGKLNYRCPRCLMREIDMDMLFDAGKAEYYCLRCSFVGDESEVLRLNAQFRAKYRDRAVRITSF
jgi:DNA-directed RNA polymerase subunit RPC12/RpoP